MDRYRLPACLNKSPVACASLRAITAETKATKPSRQYERLRFPSYYYSYVATARPSLLVLMPGVVTLIEATQEEKTNIVVNKASLPKAFRED